MFQHKPDGEVTMRFLQDTNGMPAPVMQDPLHYPHGTTFLAPGPMGQCHPIPNDSNLKESMLRAAHNHQRIHDSYNLPYDPEPGSDMDKAQKLWKRKQARRQKALEKRLQREQQKIRRMEEQSGGGKGDEGGSGRAEGPEESDFDEDDLIASADIHVGADASEAGQQQQQGGQGFAPPSIVASVTVGLNRAARALHKVLHEASIRAPPRRQLTRPQRR